jgi:acid phosphatase
MLIYILLISLINKIHGIGLHKEEIIVGDQTYNSYKFNILHHLSGISPYFESNNDQLNPSPPQGCEVDKTAYLIRHGSVYVDDYDYYHIIYPFLVRLNKSLNINQSSQFSFLSKWKSPISNNQQIEKLTKSGVLEAFKLGIELSYRYPKLLPKSNDTYFKLWTSDSQRTKQSALGIFAGLFGGTKTTGQVVNISESKNRGANSLTPTKSCRTFKSSKGGKEAKIW